MHLDPLLWLLEEGIFGTTLAKNLEQVAAILGAQSPRSTCRRGLTVAVGLNVAESGDKAQEPGGGTWVNVCWVCAAGLSEPLPHYSLFFWPIVDPILVTFWKM